MRTGSTTRGLFGSRHSAEIARLEQRLQAMSEELALEGHARARFIGRVSHELRTPITVIKGYVYTLGRGQTDVDVLAKLDVINGECERLAYLVEDLLELSRSRTGQLRVQAEHLALRECVEDTLQGLQAVADQRRVTLELRWQGGEALVRGDQNRMRQIFVKHTRLQAHANNPQTRMATRDHPRDHDNPPRDHPKNPEIIHNQTTHTTTRGHDAARTGPTDDRPQSQL